MLICLSNALLQEEKYYKNLKCLVLQYDLMVDKLIIKVCKKRLFDMKFILFGYKNHYFENNIDVH